LRYFVSDFLFPRATGQVTACRHLATAAGPLAELRSAKNDEGMSLTGCKFRFFEKPEKDAEIVIRKYMRI